MGCVEVTHASAFYIGKLCQSRATRNKVWNSAALVGREIGLQFGQQRLVIDLEGMRGFGFVAAAGF